MQFNRGNHAVRVPVGNRERLAARSGAAVQDAVLFCSNIQSNKRSDQLRTFVLNHDLAFAQGQGLRNISCNHAPGRCEQTSRAEGDSFLLKLRFGLWRTKTERGRGNFLIVFADLPGGRHPVFADPAFDHPKRMRVLPCQNIGRRVLRFAHDLRGSSELAQDRIHEWSRGTLAGPLHQLTALIPGGALGHAIEPSELIDRQPQCNQNLDVKFAEWF